MYLLFLSKKCTYQQIDEHYRHHNDEYKKQTERECWQWNIRDICSWYCVVVHKVVHQYARVIHFADHHHMNFR